jgi:hypothetical protein
LANPKDRYGEPMKGKHKCNCHGHHIHDGERISWMRRWILFHEGWDNSMLAKAADQDLSEPPKWYEKLWRKEVSLLRKEKIRCTKRAARAEWQNLWSSHYDEEQEVEFLDYNPVLLGGQIVGVGA